ncbi:recombinase family protein [Gryllotalpicola reticulitermitis]|uniref:Recombinase family protein n=1 Tax=Gryllotalpicola reticulitermitis TaxID=1184153 RepID=A0ABV8Q7M9_9MICO
MTSAAIYLRISQLTDASTSVERQEADLRALATAEGWTVIPEHVFRDEGVSGGKTRPTAQHALDAWVRGDFDVLAVWKLDRFGRRGVRDAADLIEAVDRRAIAGGVIISLEDHFRTTDRGWRSKVGLYTFLAEIERENVMLRVSNSQAYLRREGKWEGGRVPFGYKTAPHESGKGRTLEVDADEADIVRELAARLGAGELPSHIARELTERRIPTAASPYRRNAGDDRGNWSTQSVQSIMTSDTLLGRRTEWKRGPRVSADGKPYMAKVALQTVKDAEGKPRQFWPPILTPAELAAVRAVVNNPEDRAKYRPRLPQRRKATALLSGIAVCHFCGSKLYAITQTTRGGTRTLYRCAANTSVCREKASIAAPGLESHVIAHHLATFGDLPELMTTTATDAQAEHESAVADVLSTIRDVLRQMADAYSPELANQLQSLQAQRAELEAAVPPPTTTAVPTGRTHAEAWAEAERAGDTAYMRALLAWHYEEIRIRKATSTVEPVAPRVIPVERFSPEAVEPDDYPSNGPVPALV